MSGARSQQRLVRVWRLVELLHTSRFGLSPAALWNQLGVSRASLYRDIELLEQAGVPLIREQRNGEVRYRLERDALPRLAPTFQQYAALLLARQQLQPLEGTRLLEELDELLQRRGPHRQRGGSGRAQARAQMQDQAEAPTQTQAPAQDQEQA